MHPDILPAIQPTPPFLVSLSPPLSTHMWCPNISGQPSAVAMETKGPCFVMSQSAWDFTGSELRKQDTELRQKPNQIKRTSPNQEQPQLVTSCMMSCFHPILLCKPKPIFDAFEAVKVTYSECLKLQRPLQNHGLEKVCCEKMSHLWQIWVSILNFKGRECCCYCLVLFLWYKFI